MMGAELGSDQKIVPADPSQAGLVSHMFVGYMGELLLPIDDLRGWDRQGLPATGLNEIGNLESQFV